MALTKEMLSEGAKKIDERLKSFGIGRPFFHVVLSSGFKDSVQTGIPPAFQVKGEISFTEVSGLHPSTKLRKFKAPHPTSLPYLLGKIPPLAVQDRY